MELNRGTLKRAIFGIGIPIAADLLLSGCFQPAGNSLDSTPETQAAIVPTFLPTDTATEFTPIKLEISPMPSLTPTPSETESPTITPTETPNIPGTAQSDKINQLSTVAAIALNEATQIANSQGTISALEVRLTSTSMPSEVSDAQESAAIVSSEKEFGADAQVQATLPAPIATTDSRYATATEITQRVEANATKNAAIEQTQESTIEPTIIPTATETLVSKDQTYPGEAPANEFMKEGKNPFPALLDQAVEEFPIGDPLQAENSFYTSLVNDYGPLSTDPNTEGGLKWNQESIQAAKKENALDVLANKSTVTVDSLVFTNSEGIKSWGFQTDGGSRIAGGYLAGMATVYAEHPEEFYKNTKIMTVEQAMENPSIEASVERNQRAILQMTEDQIVGLSVYEQHRRDIANMDPKDPANFIPVSAQLPYDKVYTCDVYRSGSSLKSIARDQQPQRVTRVLHTDEDINGGVNGFTATDLRKEYLFFAGSFDPKTNTLANKLFTGRSYNGNEDNSNPVYPDQHNSAVAQQELPCATGVTPTATPTTPEIIIPTGEFTPFPIPSQVGPTATPRPSETSVPPTATLVQPTSTDVPTNTHDLATPTQSDSFPTPARETPTQIPVAFRWFNRVKSRIIGNRV